MQFLHSLNFKIIFLILALVCGQNAYLFYQSLHQADIRIEQAIADNLRFRLEHLNESLSYLIQKNDFLRMQEEVVGMGSDPTVKVAMLLDENDIILASLRRGDLDNELYTALKQYTEDIWQSKQLEQDMKLVRTETQRTIIGFSEDNNGVYGIYPIALGRHVDSIRPDRIGLLVLWQDLTMPKTDMRNELFEQTYSAVIAILLSASIILIMLTIWVIRPINQMNMAAQHLSTRNWEYSHQLPLQRTDEIGHLAQAFARMSTQLKQLFNQLEAKVSERTAQLEAANQEITKLNKKLQAENMRMGAELEVTRKLQQMVLPHPQELEKIDDLDIACFMEPANEVGGDYYDVLQYNGHVKIGIGDVTGHGLESGVLMLMVQTAVRTLLLNNVTDPKVFMNLLNRALYENIQRMKSDKNLTLSILDYSQGKFSLSGQHEEVLHVQRNGTIQRIDTFNLGFLVGLTEDISNFVDNMEVELQTGEGIVLYTDGITEARNATGKLYSIERLCQIIKTHWQGSAEAVKDAVITDVREHIGNAKVLDDVTLLVIKQKVCPNAKSSVPISLQNLQV
ncbi:serine phosphatase RsbU, regulator of sigma subunit [Beggiatoa alba B18LD]|uniref:Serine phosphatase RsbU, regulator of sigma subunit n=1 Tax=Beggiatoa alba B18LD TaxID=395493 RepID=I3CD31_9GAMM|nr:SpoIIE family protein phosphatase [Beggiatoa alba]EIJ41524.1 serine phosphatase RsbU, regulator of sigma subunit [Beggiatoa alba B18LD]